MTENPAQSNILIVDDDQSIGKTLLAILKKGGYQANWVPTGKEAVEIVQNDGPGKLLNIVLIDIRLADMNGLDLLRTVKNKDPDIGAIMMTGNADLETAVEALNQGAFAYIQKPYNVDEVKAFIQKALEKQRLVRENKSLMKRLQEWNSELERTVQEKTAELKAKNLTLVEVIEKLKTLNDLKSRFVTNASHELQTPMTSILGFSSMLLDYWEKVDKEQVLRFLQIIRDEAQRLTRLTRDLLDLSRIQDGRMRLEVKKINLAEISDKVSQNLKMQKDVQIKVSFEDEAKEIMSDSDKVQQVLTNLIGNAIKYSEEKTTIRVTGKSKGQIVIVSVLDQGPGIPQDQRDKIFEPFYRIQDDVGNKIRGTGLGLPIAKAIVEALGGVIRVEGEVGKGSNFTFILPKEMTENREKNTADGQPKN